MKPPAGRKRNDGARAVANHYAQVLGVPKSEMRKLTGKKFSKAQKSKRRALSPGGQEALVLALREEVPEVVLAALLCLTLGLRVSELASAQVTDGGVRVFGKGSKWRTVPWAVDPRSRSCAGPLERMRPASAARFQRACRRLAKAHSRLRGLTPHVLRHTYATNAMDAGVDPRALQAALGHDSFKTTLTYLSTIGLA